MMTDDWWCLMMPDDDWCLMMPDDDWWCLMRTDDDWWWPIVMMKVMQSQKNHGSVVALLSGKFLQIRKVFASKHIFARKHPVGNETVQMVRKLSGQSKNCTDNPKAVLHIHLLRCYSDLHWIRCFVALQCKSFGLGEMCEILKSQKGWLMDGNK